MLTFKEFSQPLYNKEKSILIVEKLVSNIFSDKTIDMRNAKTLGYNNDSPDINKTNVMVRSPYGPSGTNVMPQTPLKYQGGDKTHALPNKPDQTNIIKTNDIKNDGKQHPLSATSKKWVQQAEKEIKNAINNLERGALLSVAQLSKIAGINFGMPVQKAVQLIIKASDDLERINQNVINNAKSQTGLGKFEHPRFQDVPSIKSNNNNKIQLKDKKYTKNTSPGQFKPGSFDSPKNKQSSPFVFSGDNPNFYFNK